MPCCISTSLLVVMGLLAYRSLALTLLLLASECWGLRIYISRLESRNETKSLRETLDEYRTQGLLDGASLRFKRGATDGGRIDVANMSKNITLVLENLLKNYESSQLPSQGKDEPTVIQTNMLIRSMGPVSELDMDYSMDCYFRQYWRDSRLSFVGPIKSLSLSIKMLERIWRPDTYFYNGKQSYVHTITVPNKLLRITQEGDILYSMRLTIKANCPMELRNFPMDSQSCPLVLGSYAYTSRNLVYQWQSGDSVSFVPGMTLSQFDLMGSPQRNLTLIRRKEQYSVLQVNFNLQRNTGYFVIQVYVPCILIVVLSWVSFWIHREATSDRVGLGITTVLTLSTISLDSRKDLPKVRYATALDWFLLMSFFYCIATLLEFAGVHYFTKVGSGEIPVDEEEWEDTEAIELIGYTAQELAELPAARQARRRSSLICPIYNDPKLFAEASRRRSLNGQSASEEPTSAVIQILSNEQDSEPGDTFSLSVKIRSIEVIDVEAERRSRRPMDVSMSSAESYQTAGEDSKCLKKKTVEQQTQTEKKIPRWRQFIYCLLGNDTFRRQRQREAAKIEGLGKRHVNSVSHIDQAARIFFPLSFASLNMFYWVFYLYTDYQRAKF